jgi:TolB-like protein/DNA-binding winged helix-turn-helix (wHTH) protein
MARRYSFGSFEIDVEGFRLLKEGRQLPAEPKALNLLIFLIDHRGKLLERRAILDAVWGGAFVTDHVLNRAVGQLRKLLEDDSKQPRYIETVPTLGYRFIADVKSDQTCDSPSNTKPAAAPAAESSASAPPHAPGKNVVTGWRRVVASSVIFVVAAACAASFWALKKSGAGEAPIRSLAVLPLENLSGDSSQEYVADGMTAQLITGLAQIRALRVISQTTAMQYKNAHKALPQIAKELNVDAVVEGSVMRSNDQIRISAQLVNAPVDKQLWAGSYHGNLRDIVGLENQVASAVAERIRIQLSPQERTQLADARQIDPRAAEAYFKGNAALALNTQESEKTSLAFFQEAVKFDPHFARAYVGIARSYNFLGDWGLSIAPAVGPGEVISGADSALAKALELDPDLGEAYEERAWTLHKFRWDFQGAEARFRRALELEPGASSAHDGLAHALLPQGRFDEALREIKFAQQIDPLSLVVNTDYCKILQFAREYDLAAEQCSATVRLGPDYGYGVFMNAELYERRGDYAEAHKFWTKVNCSGACLAAMDEIYGAPGVKGAFDAWLKERPHFPAFFMARAYAGLRRKDQAFEWLEQAYELRSEASWMAFLGVDPDFDTLRSDPRFDTFLRHVGLPAQPHLPSNTIIKN